MLTSSLCGGRVVVTHSLLLAMHSPEAGPATHRLVGCPAGRCSLWIIVGCDQNSPSWRQRGRVPSGPSAWAGASVGNMGRVTRWYEFSYY